MKKVVCNMCGKDMDFYDLQQGISIYRGIEYGSKYDNEKLELDLCCECMDKLIDMCLIKPLE